LSFPGEPHRHLDRFGSLERAFAAIQRITDAESLEAIARCRREDLLV